MPQEETSPLNKDQWKWELRPHPDREFVQSLLHSIEYGVNIGYQGERHSLISTNWPSANKYSSAVTKSIEKDLFHGRKAGPFKEPPFQNFVGSPMGAFPKKRSMGKYRVIHDLSWPPGRSINDYILKEEFTLQYISIDDIASLVKVLHGKCMGSYMSKIDLEDAFKHIAVRNQDWELLGSTWYDTKGQVCYYVDLVLPFGLRSSPKLFNDFADGLEYIMKNRGASSIVHYLDDFFTCDTDLDQCRKNLDIMSSACIDIGFSLQPSKIVPPTV